MRSYHLAKFAKILISIEKFKFLQILLGDKNATSLCSKNISTLTEMSSSSQLYGIDKNLVAQKLQERNTQPFKNFFNMF